MTAYDYKPSSHNILAEVMSLGHFSLREMAYLLGTSTTTVSKKKHGHIPITKPEHKLLESLKQKIENTDETFDEMWRARIIIDHLMRS